MLRSMYSGISAMKSNQTKMDVVGDDGKRRNNSI